MKLKIALHNTHGGHHIDLLTGFFLTLRLKIFLMLKCLGVSCVLHIKMVGYLNKAIMYCI